MGRLWLTFRPRLRPRWRAALGLPSGLTSGAGLTALRAFLLASQPGSRRPAR